MSAAWATPGRRLGDAWASPDARGEIGLACPACVAHFGQVNPGRFPTIEVYRDALRRYPEPIWPDTDAASEAPGGRRRDVRRRLLNESWVFQSEFAGRSR